MKFSLKKGAWRKRFDSRRKYMRQASFIIAEYTVQEGTFRDVIKNLSAGGLFIKTHRKFRQGQPIILSFPLFKFDEIIEARG
jgi:Tfp pilus assembly protein PilZ